MDGLKTYYVLMAEDSYVKAPVLQGTGPANQRNIRRLIVHVPTRMQVGSYESLADVQRNIATARQFTVLMSTLAKLSNMPATCIDWKGADERMQAEALMGLGSGAHTGAIGFDDESDDGMSVGSGGKGGGDKAALEELKARMRDTTMWMDTNASGETKTVQRIETYFEVVYGARPKLPGRPSEAEMELAQSRKERLESEAKSRGFNKKSEASTISDDDLDWGDEEEEEKIGNRSKRRRTGYESDESSDPGYDPDDAKSDDEDDAVYSSRQGRPTVEQVQERRRANAKSDRPRYELMPDGSYHRMAKLPTATNLNRHEVVGVRYHLFIQDPDLNLDLGLTRLIQTNKKRKDREAARAGTSNRPPAIVHPWDSWKETTEAYEWLENVLGPVADIELMVNDSHKAYPLHDPRSGASLFKYLTLEAACVDYTITLLQRTESNYWKNGRFRFPSPNNTYRIPQTQFAPDLLWLARYPHFSLQRTLEEKAKWMADSNIFVELRMRQLVTRRRAHNCVVLAEPGTDDDFARLRRKIEGEVKACVDAQAEAFAKESPPRRVTPYDAAKIHRNYITKSTKALEEFATCFSKDALVSERMKAVVDWGVVRMEAAENRGESFVLQSVSGAIDPLISPFGNMVAGCYSAYENVYQTSVMHDKMFLVYVAGLGAVRSDLEMKTNVVLAGGAMAGKSHVGKTAINHFFIPKTVLRVTHDTAQAYHTSRNFMNTIFYYDEIPNAKLGMTAQGAGDGGSSDPALKSRLSEQEVNIVSYVQMEDGTRSSVITVSQQSSVMWGNTNNRISELHPAMASRVYAVDCPDIDRPGHSVPELNLIYEMSGGQASARKRDMDEWFQRMHYLVAIAEKMLQVGLLRGPLMTVSKTCFIDMLRYIQKQGFNTNHPRNFTRLENHARTLTIMNAIYIVFYTDLVFPPGKPFEFADVLRIQPYLMCTEEIAIFTFTSMISMYVNPMESVIVNAVAEKMCHFAPRTNAGTGFNTLTRWKTDPHSGNGAGVDFNYLEVTIPQLNLKPVDFLYAVARKIKSQLSGEKVSTSIEGIIDVLQELRSRKYRCTEFTAPTSGGASRGIMRDMDVLEINCTQGKMYILRQFAVKVSEPDFKDIGMRAVNAVRHRYTRPRRVVTGKSYVDVPQHPHGIIAPHVLRTVDLVPDRTREIHMYNVVVPTARYADHVDGLKQEQESLERITEEFEHLQAKPRGAVQRGVNADVFEEPKPNSVYVADEDIERTEYARLVNMCGYGEKEDVKDGLPENYQADFTYRFVQKIDGKDVVIGGGCYPERFLKAFVDNEARGLAHLFGESSRGTRKPGDTHTDDPESLKATTYLPDSTLRQIGVSEHIQKLEEIRRNCLNPIRERAEAEKAAKAEADGLVPPRRQLDASAHLSTGALPFQENLLANIRTKNTVQFDAVNGAHAPSTMGTRSSSPPPVSSEPIRGAWANGIESVVDY